jgi:hydroxymethylpyrimidine kinase/phosphomethylpyrimidine kinase
MVATTGAVLLPPEAVKDMRTLLFPQTFLVTPNIPEAKLLLSDAGKGSVEINCVEDLEKLARITKGELGPEWVLIKGGHVPFKKDGTIAVTPEERERMVDVLFGEGKITRIEGTYQHSKNTHGTGCSLASAIASNLANGQHPVEAVRAACQYVEAGIRTALGYGSGNGPLNHFHSNCTLPFAP